MTASNPLLGPLLTTPPPHAPERTTLRGRTVTLEPLHARHSSDLYASIGQPQHAALWEHLSLGPFDSGAAFADTIAALATTTLPDPIYWAIVVPSSSSSSSSSSLSPAAPETTSASDINTSTSATTGTAHGFLSLMRCSLPHRRVEVGSIILSPSLQRSTPATEALYLLARHVFETWRFRRLEWKCNQLNAPSRRAAARLGFVPEGCFRQHMVFKGRSRDTAWFAMLDAEWALVGRALRAWLDVANFDAEGVQRWRLEDVRNEVKAEMEWENRE
ncbi:MAG: hypothetical protein M1818_001225 [Claussenomyces sp. TS43310]|nr:MAG: hypothetical protein M1818_001225 [Claussenomyces sp. TS43310]